MKTKGLLLTILLSLLIISGCTKKDDATNNSNTNLIGTWNKPYSGAYITVKFKDATNYGFGFSYGGAYSETVQGTYTATNKQVVITQSGGSGAGCVGVPGSYTFVISNNQATFTVVNDACEQGGTRRSEQFGKGLFTKQ